MAGRVIRTWDDAGGAKPHDAALVEVPGEWARAVISLIRMSDEYRDTGLIITNIAPGSQAARAGMARGDVLLRYDGVELDRVDTLRHLTKRHTQGAEVSKHVVIEATRGAREMSFKIFGGRLGITVSAFLHRVSLPRRWGGSLEKQLEGSAKWRPA
jgi:hypothetical protein